MEFKLDRPLVFFDIESTGVSPRNDRIIELSGIRIAVDGTEESRTWLLNPQMPIPPDSVSIHGITDEKVANCPAFSDVIDEVDAFFAGADVAGYNSERFDIPILEEEYLRCGRAFNMEDRRSIDVQKIFFKREPRDLSAAVRFYCGRSHEGAHGAASDARATLDVFKGQLERYSDLPRTPAELEEALTPRDPLNIDRLGTLRWMRGELCVNFGRKKSTPLKELARQDRNYLKWIVNGDFPVEARLVCKRLLDSGVLPDPPPEALAQARAQQHGSRQPAERPARFVPRNAAASKFNSSLSDALGAAFGGK